MIQSHSRLVSRSRPLGALHNRRFLLLWLGLLISSAGDWINYVAMVALVYGETRSNLALAALRLSHIIPILIVAPFAGVFVDRWSRKRTLIVSPLAAGVAVGVLALVHPVPLVFAAYAAITVALTFFNPCRAAVIPQIVSDDELVSANSLSQITSTASIVLGGLAGGFIVAQIGPSGAFLFDAISFFAVSLFVLFVPIPPADSHARASIGQELGEGATYLVRDRTVGVVVVAGAIFVFAPATVLTLGYAFVQNALHGGPAAYGQMLAGLGLGSAVGAAFTIGLRKRLRQDVTFILSGILLGLGVVALGLSRGVLPAALAYGVSGFGSMANTVAGVTLLQRLVPDRVRGRIFAVSSTFDHLGAFASTALVGAGSQLLDTAGLISLSGGIAAATALLSLLGLRRSSA